MHDINETGWSVEGPRSSKAKLLTKLWFSQELDMYLSHLSCLVVISPNKES